MKSTLEEDYTGLRIRKSSESGLFELQILIDAAWTVIAEYSDKKDAERAGNLIKYWKVN